MNNNDIYRKWVKRLYAGKPAVISLLMEAIDDNLGKQGTDEKLILAYLIKVILTLGLIPSEYVNDKEIDKISTWVAMSTYSDDSLAITKLISDKPIAEKVEDMQIYFNNTKLVDYLVSLCKAVSS